MVIIMIYNEQFNEVIVHEGKEVEVKIGTVGDRVTPPVIRIQIGDQIIESDHPLLKAAFRNIGSFFPQ